MTPSAIKDDAGDSSVNGSAAPSPGGIGSSPAYRAHDHVTW